MTAANATNSLSKEADAEEEHSGIPKAEFMDNVHEFMTKGNFSADLILKQLDELISKYRFMESSLNARKSKFRNQIPDLDNSLKLIDELESRHAAGEEMKTNFLLNDNLFACAKIPPTQTVGLWLGANIMLEYPLDEAKAMLSKNLQSAQKNVASLSTDLEFLRDQITTTEVNMARVYNWDVQRRKAAGL